MIPHFQTLQIFPQYRDRQLRQCYVHVHDIRTLRNAAAIPPIHHGSYLLGADGVKNGKCFGDGRKAGIKAKTYHSGTLHACNPAACNSASMVHGQRNVYLNPHDRASVDRHLRRRA